MKKIKKTIKVQDVLLFKKRVLARRVTLSALRKGEIIRATQCEICKCESKEIEAHHIDYGKPLNVKWLCGKCHGKVHRKNHAWNPSNNKQTPMPYTIETMRTVTVSFTLPVANYLAMVDESKKRNKPIAELAKEQVMKEFAIEPQQLELKLEPTNDDAQKEREQRVQSLETNERRLPQHQFPILPKVRGKRNLNLCGMEGQFCAISKRHGANSGAL